MKKTQIPLPSEKDINEAARFLDGLMKNLLRKYDIRITPKKPARFGGPNQKT